MKEQDASALKDLAKKIILSVNVLLDSIDCLPSEIKESSLNLLEEYFKKFSAVSGHDSNVILNQFHQEIIKCPEELLKVEDDIAIIEVVEEVEKNVKNKIDYNDNNIETVIVEGKSSSRFLMDTFGEDVKKQDILNYLEAVEKFLRILKEIESGFDGYKAIIRSITRINDLDFGFEDVKLGHIEYFSRLMGIEDVMNVPENAKNVLSFILTIIDSENALSRLVELTKDYDYVERFLDGFDGLDKNDNKTLEAILNQRHTLTSIEEMGFGGCSFNELKKIKNETKEFIKSVSKSFEIFERNNVKGWSFIEGLTLGQLENFLDISINKIKLRSVNNFKKDIVALIEKPAYSISELTLFLENIRNFNKFNFEIIIDVKNYINTSENCTRENSQDIKEIKDFIESKDLNYSTFDDILSHIDSFSFLIKKLESIEEKISIIIEVFPKIKLNTFGDWFLLSEIFGVLLNKPFIYSELDYSSLKSEERINFLEKALFQFNKLDGLKKGLVDKISIEDLPDDFDLTTTRRELRGISSNWTKWFNSSYIKIKKDLKRVIKKPNVDDNEASMSICVGSRNWRG